MTDMASDEASAGNLARANSADLWIEKRVATLPAQIRTTCG
jgi:hypothetical protein